MRTDMGERYEWMAAYALDRFQSYSVRSAMRKLMTWLSRPIPSERLLNISVPTTLIWGRHDVGMPLHVAEDASERYGWPLQVIEDSRDDPALEQPRAFLAAFDAALSR
jgi:pimeloyl-ACP methyl ester carboxylesterase